MQRPRILAGIIAAFLALGILSYAASGQTVNATEAYLSAYREAILLAHSNAWFARDISMTELLTNSLKSISLRTGNRLPTFSGKDEERLEEAVRYLRPIFSAYESNAAAQESLFTVALINMLRDIDAYAMPLSPNPASDVSFQKFVRWLGLEDFGDGLVTQEIDNNLWVVGTIPNTPAAAADFKFGDQILEINGFKMEPYNEENEFRGLDDAYKKKKSSYILRRLNQTFTVELPFRTRATPLVKGELWEGKIGDIRIPTFDAGTGFEARDLVKQLIDTGAKGFILDLRGNPGGLSMEGQIVTSIFKQGNLLQRWYRKGVATERSLPVDIQFNGPLAILVDENSASASEVISFVLRDRARLFGENASHTYGKGIGQAVYALSNGWYFMFTVSQFYDFNGNTYHGRGVPVHETIKVGPDQRQNGKDPTRTAAIAWLLQQINK